MTVVKEKVYRAIYQDGQHEFVVSVDISKLDPALFVKALRSAQKRATLGHGAVSVQHLGKLPVPRLKKA